MGGRKEDICAHGSSRKSQRVKKSLEYKLSWHAKLMLIAKKKR